MTMKYKPYPAYKDSGVEWLGEIPTDWELKRLRFVAYLNPSRREAAAINRNTEVSFLPMEAIGDDGSLNLEYIRPVDQVESGYTYFREGDVTIAKITPCFENGKGAIMRGLWGGIGFGTTELIVVRPQTTKTTSIYLHWLFLSTLFRKLGESAMYGAGGQKRVPGDFIRNFTAAFPPLPEQQTIATFLDCETTQIDTLIAKQEHLIELLQEKRTALISHAVTKGLNPDAPMKDSGIPWLGEVPAHWEVSGLTKYLESVVDYRGRTPTKVVEGVFLLTARNIRNGTIDYDVSQEFIAESEYEEVMRRGKPVIGDLLFITEAPLGQVANVDRADIALAQRIIKFRGQPGVLNNYFLKYWIMGRFCQSNLEQLATGSTALGIKGSKVGQVRLCLPPYEEQGEITQYLDQQPAKIDTLIQKARHAIDLLKERRAALISAAVTGKIDVRDGVCGNSSTGLTQSFPM